MTSAPSNLLAARRLLLTHLGPDARPPAGVTILDPLGDPVWEVGIVGDADHRGGYHCGSDRLNPSTDYSVVESPRDKAGLTLHAAALDVGKFQVRTPKGVFDLPHYSRWLVEQCKAGTADTRHLREVIYSPDGRTVRRWDRLGRRSTGDSSHLGHTHESYFRDAIKAGADVSAVKRRYLTTIGLIQAPSTVEADMSAKASDIIEAWAVGKTATPTGSTVEPVKWRIRDEAWQRRVDGLLVALAAAVEGLDMDAVLRRIDEHAAADATRDAELRVLVEAVDTGERDAAEVVRLIGERLAASTPAS